MVLISTHANKPRYINIFPTSITATIRTTMGKHHLATLTSITRLVQHADHRAPTDGHTLWMGATCLSIMSHRMSEITMHVVADSSALPLPWHNSWALNTHDPLQGFFYCCYNRPTCLHGKIGACKLACFHVKITSNMYTDITGVLSPFMTRHRSSFFVSDWKLPILHLVSHSPLADRAWCFTQQQRPILAEFPQDLWTSPRKCLLQAALQHLLPPSPPKTA